MPEVGYGMGKAVDETREEGRGQVIEGPTGHMRDFDIYPMGNPQSEGFSVFFSPGLRSRWMNVKNKDKNQR